MYKVNLQKKLFDTLNRPYYGGQTEENARGQTEAHARGPFKRNAGSLSAGYA